jgi:hypothetical protein
VCALNCPACLVIATSEGGCAWLYPNCPHMSAAWPPTPHLPPAPQVQLMHARRRVAPGEELTWDYRAVTDDPQDPLLQEVCRCRDKQCPGCLLTYVGAVQSAPITAEVFSS